MKTIEIQLYKFEELSEAAQKHTIDKNRNFNVDGNFWSDNEIDFFKEAGAIIGIEIDKVYFSGFWSQGDGACFEGFYRYKTGSLKNIKEQYPTLTWLHDTAKSLQDLQKKHFYQLTANVKQRGHYYHSHCTQIDVDTLNSDRYLTGDTEQDLIDILRSFMDDMYNSLEKEFDSLTTDEAVKESLISNEYDFTSEGDIY